MQPAWQELLSILLKLFYQVGPSICAIKHFWLAWHVQRGALFTCHCLSGLMVHAKGGLDCTRGGVAGEEYLHSRFQTVTFSLGQNVPALAALRLIMLCGHY